MARRKGISSNKSRHSAANNAAEQVSLPRPQAQDTPAACSQPAPAPAPDPAPAAAPVTQSDVYHADNRGSATMPLTQEKPRFEISFTNNNDHNYLHKKFKKMASTVPVGDEQSSESDSSLHRDTPKPQTSQHSSISNRSIAAAHPEIEKIKYRAVTGAGINRTVENNVQTNFRVRPDMCDVNIVNQNTGETSFDEENANKTENIETDVPRDPASGAGGRYVCPYCRLTCAKPSVLQKHIRAHTNERPYPCVPCGIAFKTKSNLYKHRRSRSHAVRSQGGENAPPINEEDWSPESESDTSLPATSVSETGSDGVVLRLGLDNSRTSELSSPELSGDRVSPATSSNPPNSDSSKMKTIYKPKFHRASLYQDEDEKNKKILSPNPNFLNEHISKIISDNEAIVDILETPLQKKYGKIKQIAESKQLLIDESVTILEIKNEPVPLNLSKGSNDEITRRKRCHSESFGHEYYKHPLNPEGSIIKDLLLKTKNYTTGLLPVTSGTYDSSDALYVCPLCNISYKSAENLDIHRTHYCKGNTNSNGISVSSLSPREVMKSFRTENVFMRSNSINVTLQETQNNSSSARQSTLRSPLNNLTSKPDNLVIIKPESNDIIAPLPSPGPLLGNTRLVDSRMSADYSRNKIDNVIKMKPVSSPKRRLDSRADAFSPRLGEDVIHQRMDSYPQSKLRCFENNPTTLRSLEELSHSPMRQNSTSLQMFGGEVKIINNSGSTTTLRIEPTRQLSPIMVPQNMSPNKLSIEGEASNIVQSGLHSGGTMVHNPPTPKESTNSPHPQTPRIMLSIAASIPTPNLTVTALPTHFQFPPLGAITAFNPLTLPPLSPSVSPNGATTILHGGKLIPHVPGIPGPNTPAPYVPHSGMLLKYPQNSDYSRSHSCSPKEEAQQNRALINQPRPKIVISQSYDNQATNLNLKISPTVRHMTNHSPSVSTNDTKVLTAPIPRFKIRHAGEKLTVKKSQPKIDEKVKDKNTISEIIRHDIQKSPKPTEKINNIHSPQHVGIKMTEHQEIRNFNFENFITKSEIYNNSGHQSTSGTLKATSPQEPLTISVQTSERSETSYFQKNINAKTAKEESKSRFLRPSTLPLKPGTFTPKKHHGITPNANTMPLISPETPRPAKAYGQLYLNGNAYTYLGLKCSTKVFYCTLNRPQPTYVPNQVSLSMYCNWQILLEQAPNPLGLSTISFMSLYDSRHRPQDVSIATIQQDQILTHSSQWNKDFQEYNQRPSIMDTKKMDDSKPVSAESSAKSKELAGGFESNEEYTYVRGRGRGRYVCLECGIRCKKPSMLKKHIRTHTDVRPYTCKHCSFSFKTKGNLTKHMKSKAHYKKCCELGINPNEGTDMDTSEMNQGSGETDDDSDSDMDDGNEGETESSDTDSWKSRLPEHEAAHCLLSLSGSTPSSMAAPGLLTSARPSTYPYAPTGKDETTLLRTTKCSSANSDTCRNAVAETAMELDNEPMDLSRGEIKSGSLSDIHTARECSVLASLASNTAKLPLQVQWTNGEPMLHAYLTEKALQDTKIKQSQFISSLSKNIRKQELSKILQQESSNLVLNSYGTHDSTPKTPSTPSVEVYSVSIGHAKPTSTLTVVSRAVTTCIVTAEPSPKTVSSSNRLTSPVTTFDTSKGIVSTETNTSTENAKFVASEYLKMARSKAENSNTTDKNDQHENNKTAFNHTIDDNDKGDIRENSESELKNMHSEPYPLARKVVIGAGGVAFKVDSKSKDYQGTSAYTPGRLTEDGRSVCVVCNKSFTKPSQLRLHINIHYMERPYRCSACAVSFRTRGHLQKHERSGSHHNKVSMTSTFGAATSSNPRPFRCSDCNIAFRIHGHLAKHLRSKMHVMRLECLSKLPFGTFAEIERAGVSLTDIDTTDCANSLASLQLLAQKLHEKDPTKLESWDPTMVPPLLPAGRESSDDEDGGLVVDSKLNENSEKDSELRIHVNNEGHHMENMRIMYSATDT